MSEAAAKKKDAEEGAPAWVMTFADLMSLLMCFFVLLLSFSELDLLRFKQIAGSMRSAFGVQRTFKVEEMPKGTSVIAREFTPGRPAPTVMDEIRQNTIDETRQSLEFTDAVTDTMDVQDNAEAGESSNLSETAPIQKVNPLDVISDEYEKDSPDSGDLKNLSIMTENLSESLMHMIRQFNELLSKEQTEEMQEAAKQAAMIKDEVANLIDEENQEYLQPIHEQTELDADMLLQALAPEVEEGIVEIETEGTKILVRIKERGSFPSGSSDLIGGFLPVIDKLRDSLNIIDGKIIVAGHTDNVPIKTSRFRSNWELSSSRAVTVVHELLKDDQLDQQRFEIQGHGEAFPIAPNDTPENRALNRRVELIIVKGPDAGDTVSELSAEEIPGDEKPEEMEAALEEPTIADGEETLSTAAEEHTFVNPEPGTEDPVIEGQETGDDEQLTSPTDDEPFTEPGQESVEAEAEQATKENIVDVQSLQNQLKAISDGLNENETNTQTGE